MPFTIPNEVAATFPAQARLFAADIDALVAGTARTGVLSGCAVTAQGSPDMTVAVAAGTVEVAGVRAIVAAGNVTITAADATNPRIDLVVVNSAGTKSVAAGTAAAAPTLPALPANSAPLAAVYVPANDTAINTNQITDKRVLIHDTDPATFNAKEWGCAGDGSTDDTTKIAALMAAVNTAGGGIAHFPKGTYLTTEDVLVPSNCWVRGDGIDLTTIKLKDGPYTVANSALGGVNLLRELASSQSNMQITDLTLDQNRANSGLSITSNAAIDAQSHCLDIRNAARVVVERVRVINAIKWSIHLLACTDSRVTSCYVVSGGTTGVTDQQDGIHTTNCQRILISNNNVDTGTTGDGDDTIVVRSTDTVGGGASSDTSIVGNMMRSGQRGVALVSEGQSLTNISVTGNTVWWSRNSAVILNYYPHATPGMFRNITIAGNTFEDIVQVAGAGHGINIQRPAAATDGFDNLTITGNSIKTMISTTNNAIQVSRGKGLVLSSNVLTDIRSNRGIVLGDAEPPVQNFIISNNRIDMTAGAASHIALVVGYSDDGTIVGNEITTGTSSGTTGIFIIGGNVSPQINVVGLSIVGNRIQGFGIGISNTANGATPTTNQYVANSYLNCVTPRSLTGSNLIVEDSGITLSGTGGLGYATGAGGTATQSPNKTSGVTLNKVCGAVTMANSALASAAIVSFTLTNSTIAATDVIALNHASGGTAGAYTVNAQAGAGSAVVTVRNNTAGSLSEAIVLRFAVIKAVTA
jgi:polygalacturonase